MIISGELKQEIKNYAIKNSHEESCGLIVKIQNDLKFIPSRNLSMYPVYTFEIDYNLFIENEVECVFHSHIKDKPKMSVADKKLFKSLGLPFLIYSIRYDEFCFYNCV
jgi:proteasome lid subunit RPN8/RPN11